MPKEVNMSGVSKLDQKVSLLGGGLSGPSAPPRLFPGDLISFRADKPYEWLPWFGVVLSPNNAMARYMTTGTGRPKQATLEPSKKSLESSRQAASTTLTLDTILEVDEVTDLKQQIGSIPEDGIPDPVYVNWAHSQRVAMLRDRKDIAVVDRSLVKGQRVKNSEGVSGTVVDRTEKVTLQVISTNHVIDNVNAQHLSPVAVYFRGREIEYDGWIGVVTAVRRLVTCRLENGGSYFYLKTNETDGFVKPDPYWGVGMPCPGLPTKFAPATMKKAVFAGTFMRFIHRWVPPVSYFYTRSAARTIGVETISLDVMWIERCPNIPAAPLIPPPPTLEKVDLQKVKPLGLPNYETIGLNSVRMYGMKPDDAVMSYGNWYAGFQSKFFGTPETNYARLSPAPSILTSVLQDAFQIPVKVIYRQTEVEVEWDNGLSEHLLAARIPTVICSPTMDSDLETGYVVESALGDMTDTKYGVVLHRVESETKSVKVRWIELDSIDIENRSPVEESVLDLKIHPTVSTYSRGTTVYLADHPNGYTTGTITGIDLKTGKVMVAVPFVVEPIPVHAHTLTPISKRTYWNFAERKWIQEPVTLPSGQVSKATIKTSQNLGQLYKVTKMVSGKPKVIDLEEEKACEILLVEMKEELKLAESDTDEEPITVNRVTLPGNVEVLDAADKKVSTEQINSTDVEVNEPITLQMASEAETSAKIEAVVETANENEPIAENFSKDETSQMEKNPEEMKPQEKSVETLDFEQMIDQIFKSDLKDDVKEEVMQVGQTQEKSPAILTSQETELLSDFNLLGDFPEVDSGSDMTSVTSDDATTKPDSSMVTIQEPTEPIEETEGLEGPVVEVD